jgi:hypothetical protein
MYSIRLFHYAASTIHIVSTNYGVTRVKHEKYRTVLKLALT